MIFTSNTKLTFTLQMSIPIWSRFRVPISATLGFVSGIGVNKIWKSHFKIDETDKEEEEAASVAVWHLERFPRGPGDGTYRLYHNNQKTEFVYRANFNNNIVVPKTIFLDPKQIMMQ